MAFQGTAQSWQELYFRTGLGRGGGWGVGGRKLLLTVKLFLFFFFTPIIMKAAFLVLAEWSQRDHAAIRKGGGEFSPGQGDVRGPSRGREAIMKNKNKKIEL